MPITNAINPKWHENPWDSTLITIANDYSSNSLAFVGLKKCVITKRVHAIMEIIALLSIGIVTNIVCDYIHYSIATSTRLLHSSLFIMENNVQLVARFIQS